MAGGTNTNMGSPGATAQEQLMNERTYQARRNATETSPETKALVDMVSKMLRPDDPYGSKELRSVLTQISGLLQAHNVIPGNPVPMFDAAASNFATAGFRMNFRGPGTAGLPNQLPMFGNGAATMQMAEYAISDLKQRFYNSDGAARLNQTYGMSSGDMGTMFNEIGKRGAFRGMQATATMGADGKAKDVRLDQADQRRIEEMMSDTAETLGVMRNIFGGGPAQQLMAAAEALSGGSFGSQGGAKKIKERLQQSVTAATSFGLDARQFMQDELAIVQMVEAQTGSRGAGQASSLEIRSAAERAKYTREVYANANPERFVPEFNYEKFVAEHGAVQGGMMADDAMLGDPRSKALFAMEQFELTDQGRSEIDAAYQSAVAAKTPEEMQAAAALINETLIKHTGTSLQGMDKYDYEEYLSPEAKKRRADDNFKSHFDQQSKALLPQFRGGVESQLGGFQFNNDEEYTEFMTGMFQNTTEDERQKMFEALEKGNMVEFEAALQGSSMSVMEQGLINAAFKNSGMSGKEFSASMEAIQTQLKAGGLEGWMSAPGSAAAKAFEAQAFASEMESMSRGTGANTNLSPVDAFLHGFMGGDPFMQNNQIADIAKASNSEAFSIDYDAKNQSFTGKKEDLEKAAKALQADVGNEKFLEHFGTTDVNEVVAMMQEEGGAQKFRDLMKQSSMTEGMLEGGQYVGVGAEQSDKILSAREKVKNAEAMAGLKGQSLSEGDRERMFQNALTLSGSKMTEEDTSITDYLEDNASGIFKAASSKGGGKQKEVLKDLYQDEEYRKVIDEQLEAAKITATEKGQDDKVKELDKLHSSLRGSTGDNYVARLTAVLGDNYEFIVEKGS